MILRRLGVGATLLGCGLASFVWSMLVGITAGMGFGNGASTLLRPVGPYLIGAAALPLLLASLGFVLPLARTYKIALVAGLALPAFPYFVSVLLVVFG